MENNLLKDINDTDIHSREKTIKKSSRNLLKNAVNYLVKVSTNTEYQMLEHALRNEVVHNPILADAVYEPDHRNLNYLSKFFKVLGSPDPESDASQIIALFWFLTPRFAHADAMDYSQE